VTICLVHCVCSLQLGELLGEGAFGKVYKGFALGIDGRMEPAVVAVKMLKGIITVFILNQYFKQMIMIFIVFARHLLESEGLGCAVFGMRYHR
jgi:Protein tyrosine and serine/threonine kinase